ncbi:MAG: membrane-bound lytic murein transglycosylase MltF [Gammaproteobacteria bacterium]
MIKMFSKHGGIAVLWLFVAGALSSSSADDAQFNEQALSNRILKQIKKNHKLVVLTRKAPTTYFEHQNGPDGFEYHLTQMLGDALQVDVEYVVYDNNEEILQALREGKGHIAAAGLGKTEAREKQVRFGPDYKTVQQQVVCNRHVKLPKEPRDLGNLSLQVVAGSSSDERLQKLKTELPQIRWLAARDMTAEALLKQVWQGKTDCTIADSNVVALNRRYYPELAVAFSFPHEHELAWGIPENADGFAAYLDRWFTQLEKNDDLERLDEKAYGFAKHFDYMEHAAFSSRIDKKLPRYKRLFQKASNDREMPWTLVAAVAYQESHWRSNAVHAGASGLMMLTHGAAREVHVKNRMDPVQNVHGGTRYLEQITKSLPPEIQGEDRYWMALAAYNAGLGHLLDALKLTKQLGRNPDYWADVKITLPLLAQAKYYRKLKHGYAKGPAIVRYVEKIRNYRDILEKKAANHGV